MRIAFLFFLLTGFCALAQRDSIALSYLRAAKTLTLEKKNLEAHQKFKKLFSLKKVIPNEAAYWYAVNLLELKKNGQSKAAFKKYLKLTGDTGEYYSPARQYLSVLDCQETGYKEVIITCEICYGDTILVECSNCKGKGIEVCPVCRGNGVVSTQGPLGRTFHTCQRCNGEKVVTCSVCKGDRKVRDLCKSCGGTGKLKVKRKCED
jgi:hypothetical protein